MERVLLVEDDPLAAACTRGILRNHGVACEWAQSCAEAVRAADQGFFALALLDMYLPDGDAIGLCERLRQIPSTMDVPVIVITAGTDEGVLRRSFEAGAYDFLRKPVHEIELLCRVNNAFRLHRAQVGGAHAHRLEALGQLAAALSHEVNNPLAALSYHLQALREEVGPEAHRRLELCMQAVDRVKHMVADVRKFARPDDSADEAVALSDCVRVAVKMLSFRQGPTCRVMTELGGAASVRANPALLAQAVTGLLDLALTAVQAAGGGEVRVCTTAATLTIEEIPVSPGPPASPHLEWSVANRILSSCGVRLTRQGSLTCLLAPAPAEVIPS